MDSRYLISTSELGIYPVNMLKATTKERLLCTTSPSPAPRRLEAVSWLTSVAEMSPRGETSYSQHHKLGQPSLGHTTSIVNMDLQSTEYRAAQ